MIGKISKPSNKTPQIIP